MCNGRAAYSSATSYRLLSRSHSATTAIFSLLLHLLSFFIGDRQNFDPGKPIGGMDQNIFSLPTPTPGPPSPASRKSILNSDSRTTTTTTTTTTTQEGKREILEDSVRKGEKSSQYRSELKQGASLWVKTVKNWRIKFLNTSHYFKSLEVSEQAKRERFKWEVRS